ncbi:uncharacterized protein [Neodiprion pinetum]|uniref:Uncharacterized protein LOC124294598 n=1 Tax=Neodiprion lecontei TaxID=441921 RepID=A0ABM3G884_NEOLC|nr:uncharacterized protein LOC124294598 [Neodiprion lecontei]
MSEVKPNCVFCRKATGKLQPFVINTLNKSAHILSIRKANNLDLNSIIIPQEVNDYQRYHSSCYSKFTAVSKKYQVVPAKEKPSKSTSNVHVEEESVHDDSSAGPSTSKANLDVENESFHDDNSAESSTSTPILNKVRFRRSIMQSVCGSKGAVRVFLTPKI